MKIGDSYTVYVVYVAGRDSMEIYQKFSEEAKAIRCADNYRYSGGRGSIWVYKETYEKIHSA